VGVITDVTHRKLAEEAMVRAEKLAVAGKLAASVAHEINNPLAAVANLLYLISTSETVESARARAGDALDELMRAALVTQQTLKFHRQTGAPKPARLSQLVEAMVELFRAKMHSAHVSVDVRVRNELSVSCMAGEMQQVFANLISNAVEAMPRGGQLVIRIRQSLDWRDGRTTGMRVTFLDTGPGMDRATMRRVFEPFFTTKEETGTGLGMWVVEELVDRHQGQVRGWSRTSGPISGTAFTVFLPFRGVPERADPGEAELEAARVVGVAD
jgi:two-component system CheB/CheR fusion protein